GWAPPSGCSGAGETQPRASRRCTSARKAIPICERCWCKGHTTFWDPLERTAIGGAGVRSWPSVGEGTGRQAIIATARKLAVLLHRLWVSGEVYEPLHNSKQSPLAIAA